MKKTLALLLALTMLFTLAACGTSETGGEGAGVYYCVEAEREYGINWPDGERIELYEDGTCMFYEGEASGWETPGKWMLDGSDLTLRFYGEKYEADLSRGELELEDYNGASYLFSDDESDIPDESERPVPAPGNTDAPDPEYGDFDIGYYTGSYGVTYSSDPMQGEYVELYDDLTGMISTAYGVEYFDWYVAGEMIYLSFYNGDYVEGFNDGYSLELYYNDINYTFEWETEPQYDDVAAELPYTCLNYWNRDWYGWWCITDGYGEWSDATGNWWDCGAAIHVEPDGYSWIEFWDEDYSRYDLLSFTEGWAYSYDDGDPGYLLMDSGYFMDSAVTYWDVDPAYSEFDELLAIDGYYEDPNNSENYFYYSIYLRPWGRDWSDVEADDSSNLPYYYYDWYLPSIEAGMDMPDYIG